jgi:hypothetical protein
MGMVRPPSPSISDGGGQTTPKRPKKEKLRGWFGPPHLAKDMAQPSAFIIIIFNFIIFKFFLLCMIHVIFRLIHT